MFGNLVAMHEGLKSNQNIPVDTPYLCFEVGSWSVPDARPAYRLIKYEKFPFSWTHERPVNTPQIDLNDMLFKGTSLLLQVDFHTFW